MKLKVRFVLLALVMTMLGCLTVSAENLIDIGSSRFYGSSRAKVFYTGKAIPESKFMFFVMDKTLNKEVDPSCYSVVLQENMDMGRWKVTFKGIESKGYTGSTSAVYYIYYNMRDLVNFKTKFTGNYVYTGEELKPVPEITYRGTAIPEASDHKLSWGNNINAGQGWVHIQGGNYADYTGLIESRFDIQPAPISTAKIEVADMEYTGKALKPEPVVTFNGKTLVKGTDYEITGYADNVEASDTKPAVTLEGKGNFSGTVKKSFRIKVTRVTSVKLNKTSAKMLANKTVTLKATVSPSNAANKAVTWTTSDKTIATVSSTGKVTGKKGGKVTITATTVDGKKTAKCEVQVYNKIRVPLQDGKYYLFTSKLGNFCMTVPDKSKKAGTSLALIKQNLSGWQKFKVKKVTKDGGEYYALINKNSGLAVTWVKSNGGDFVQKKYTGANSQLFFAMRYGDNSLQLINKLSNRAIGIPGGKAVRKANVGPVKFGAGLEQRWINAVSAD